MQRSDQEIEAAFLSVGEQALPAAAQNAITIYWIPGQGSGQYVPYALMIDCTEPLWRTRQEPKLVPANSNDPSFTIVQISSATALEVHEKGGNAVAHFVYSTSGTRTIAILASGSSGAQTVTLQLHRPASQVFGLSDFCSDHHRAGDRRACAVGVRSCLAASFGPNSSPCRPRR